MSLWEPGKLAVDHDRNHFVFMGNELHGSYPTRSKLPSLSEKRGSLSSLTYHLEKEGNFSEGTQTAILVMSVDSSVKVISSSLYSVIFTTWETRTSVSLAATDFKVDYVQAGICM